MVSGGQTGADRAALDWALYRGIECGGWCPKGRKAEDGPIAKRYPLIETPTQSTILVQCDRSLEAEHVWNRPRWPGRDLRKLRWEAEKLATEKCLRPDWMIVSCPEMMLTGGVLSVAKDGLATSH